MPAIPSYQPRYKLPAFVLILLLAAAGRINHIDLESLWVDEGFSYWAIRHPDMFGLILRDVHPPLYFVLLRGWAEVAGITELALRYLSVLPGLLSVAAIYHVARELERARGGTAETVVPLLAALLLALADMEIYIAQQVRMYTWHVLWAVLSMWAFTRWTRTGGRRSLAAWVATSLLLLYTHYIGVCW
jgi:mannosyltransferase